MSERRILTTHTGSLPRPVELLGLLGAGDRGERIDEFHLSKTVATTVCDLVSRQREVGLDIVGDGEASKTSYFAYVSERVSGFTPVPQDARAPAMAASADLRDFPEYAQQYLSNQGAPVDAAKQFACHGVSRVFEPYSPRGGPRKPRDRGRLGRGRGGLRLCGVAGHPQPDAFQPVLRRPGRLPRCDRRRDEGRVRSHPPRRFRAPDRLSGPRLGPSHAVPGQVHPTVSENHRDSCRGAQSRNLEHPQRSHAHARVLGELRRAAPLGRSFRRHRRHRASGPPRGSRSRVLQSTPQSRVGHLRGDPLASREGLDSGSHRVEFALHRASRGPWLSASSGLPRSWGART